MANLTDDQVEAIDHAAMLGPDGEAKQDILALVADLQEARGALRKARSVLSAPMPFGDRDDYIAVVTEIEGIIENALGATARDGNGTK